MRIKAVTAGVVAMTAVSTMVLTPGIAAADDYAGKKYQMSRPHWATRT